MSLVRELLSLPPEVPDCVVQVRQFDRPEAVEALLRDFVLTEQIRKALLGSGGKEAVGLLHRMKASVERHEAGEGHWLHGSFGSGKSHVMSIIGMLASDRKAVFEQTDLGQEVDPSLRAWIASHPMLAVPIFMLNAPSLERQVYLAVNERLAELGHPPCPFYDLDAVFARVDEEVEYYGEQAWGRLSEAGLDRDLFEQQRDGTDADRAELAVKVRAALKLDRDDATALYPKDLSTAMVILSKHARELGYHGVVLLIDELILFLSGKEGRTYMDEVNALGSLVDDKGHRVCPVWAFVARQRNIDDTIPDDKSEQHIKDALQRLNDRFPLETQLEDRDLVEIVRGRVLKARDGQARQEIDAAVNGALAGLDEETRQQLVGAWDPDDLRHLYPFHPILVKTLVDIGNQLSRERTAIRILYDLLINRHPDLELGEWVPYASVFDVVFPNIGKLLGSGIRRSKQLEAVQRVWHEELRPAIRRVFTDEEDCRRADVAVKTVLLFKLTREWRDQITVGRVVHVNINELLGRRQAASYGRTLDLFRALSRDCPAVQVHEGSSPADAVIDILVHEGISLAKDVLPKVTVSAQDKNRAFRELLQGLLGVQFNAQGVIVGYKHAWRGISWPAYVRLANVADLEPEDVRQEGKYVLVIDQPFDLNRERGADADEAAINRAAKAHGAVAVGYWLPGAFDDQELRDLEELAKLNKLVSTDPADRPAQNSVLGHLAADDKQRVTQEIHRYRTTKLSSLQARINALYLQQARCVFLSGVIQPDLNAGTLPEALRRVGDEVLVRLHPGHPKFPKSVTTTLLSSFLDRVALPMLEKGEPVRLDQQAVRDLVVQVAEPLELGQAGSETWRLNENSRYLLKVESSVAADPTTNALRDDLRASYGFVDELIDFFILLLIKGRGYRAFDGDQAVPLERLNFGRLRGLRLAKGKLLAAAEWGDLQKLIRQSWGSPKLRPYMTDEVERLSRAVGGNRSLPVQDDVWRTLHLLANRLRPKLLAAATQVSQVAKAVGPQRIETRLAATSMAGTLNHLAVSSEADSCDALRRILSWHPETGTASAAHDSLAATIGVGEALSALNEAVLGQVTDLAERDGAQEQLSRLAAVIDNVGAESSLKAVIEAWNQQAAAWVVGSPKPTVDPPPPGPGPKPKPGTADAISINEKTTHTKLAEVWGSIQQQVKEQVSAGARSFDIHIDIEDGADAGS